MWGNSLGWGISAVLMMAVFGVLWVFHSATELSPPDSFGTNPAHLAVLELPVPPEKVAPFMSRPGDSGPLYRQALANVERDHTLYWQYGHNKAPSLDDIAKLTAVDLLVQAMPMKDMDLFLRNPAEVVNYQPEKPALDTLDMLAKIADRKASLLASTDPAGAITYFEAEFSLGCKLYRERLIFEEYQEGISMMADGAAGIAWAIRREPHGDKAWADALEDFNKQRAGLSENLVQPMWRVISSVDQGVIEQYAGDVFYFAQHSQDRMWRVESILKVGRYRFDAGRSADQFGAQRLLKRWADDPNLDPVFRTAAAAGRDLTIIQYRDLR